MNWCILLWTYMTQQQMKSIQKHKKRQQRYGPSDSIVVGTKGQLLIGVSTAQTGTQGCLCVSYQQVCITQDTGTLLSDINLVRLSVRLLMQWLIALNKPSCLKNSNLLYQKSRVCHSAGAFGLNLTETSLSTCCVKAQFHGQTKLLTKLK